MATIAEARKWLTGIKATLERPVDFYASHYQQWRQLAASVAETTLQRLKPANVTQEKWTIAIARSLTTLSAELISSADVVGARLWMLRQIEPSAAGFAPYHEYVPYETVVDWVAAGRAGDELGKKLELFAGGRDVKADGTPKTDRAVAWRVWHAIRLDHNRAGLVAAINEFAEQAGDPQVLKAMDAVQEAWNIYFSVQVVEDWKRWVATVIRQP